MAHIGIKRLGTSRTEEYSSQHEKAGPSVPEQVVEAVSRIERSQDTRMTHNTEQSEDADGHKPKRHDRAEQSADAGSALRLQGEHGNQNDNRKRKHVGG